MAKFDYIGMRGVADSLIKRFGGNFQYTSVSMGTYNPATRAQTDSSSTVTVKGVILGPMNKFIQGTIVKVCDARFILSAKGLTITPRQGDRITAASIVYYVQDAKRIKPDNSTDVVWILELKAGVEQ